MEFLRRKAHTSNMNMKHSAAIYDGRTLVASGVNYKLSKVSECFE